MRVSCAYYRESVSKKASCASSLPQEFLRAQKCCGTVGLIMCRDIVTVRGWLTISAAWVMGIALTGASFHALHAQVAPEAQTIREAEAYFPDVVGSSWHYQGEVATWPLQSVASKRFLNVSTVTGNEDIDGVTVTVFHDTNPGNHGPSDSYYRRDAAGIVYYGSSPGTAIERQLIPYQIVRFPLEIPSSFQQFDRQQLDFGEDLDGDAEDEKMDVRAIVKVVGKETVQVSGGSYPEALRIEARMTMRIHLTRDNRAVVGTDVLTAWFARGVGLIKYSERQTFPPIQSDRGIITEIVEELEKFEIKGLPASGAGRESTTERVLADYSSDHELGEVVLTSSLRSHSR